LAAEFKDGLLKQTLPPSMVMWLVKAWYMKRPLAKSNRQSSNSERMEISTLFTFDILAK
jgi:hypothetical protein